MTDDLSRVLADIDSLLPPGAPSTPDLFGEDWEAEAMRWEPVDHEHHPDRPAPAAWGDTIWHVPDWQSTFTSLIPPQFRRHRLVDPAGSGLERRWLHGPEMPASWPAIWVAPGRAMIRGAVGVEYAASIQALTYSAQSIGTSLQRLQQHQVRHDQAQAVIEARRNRNTGPTNPNGLDGRPRRHQHPRKAAARNASPATQGSATPVLVTWRDGALALGFDPAWQ